MKLNMSVLGRIRILLAERTSADEIDAQGVPRNVLNILLDGNLPALEMALLKRLADHTGFASAFNLGPWSNERAVLAQRQFKTLSARVQQVHMTPLDGLASRMP